MRSYYVAIPKLPIPPSLDDPACVNHLEVFDAAIEGRDRAAEQRALNVCRGCPARQPCTDWYMELPKGKRPIGVTAGLVYRPRMQRQISEPTMTGAPVTVIQQT